MRFVCDFCEKEKQPGESWILGIAAENVAPSAARREVLLASGWDQKRLCHPLAVHFCSRLHAENYIASLFGTPVPLAEETVVTTTLRAASPRVTKRRVVRSITSRRVKSTARKKQRRSA